MDEKEKVSAEEAETTEAPEEKLYSEKELNDLLEKGMTELRKKLAETEKLALMDAEEKVKYRREMAEKELAQREAAVAKRELMAAAIEKLSEAELPKQLASCLCYDSEEECDRSILAVSEAFREAVTKAVNQRLKGNTPKLITETDRDAFLDGLGIE